MIRWTYRLGGFYMCIIIYIFILFKGIKIIHLYQVTVITLWVLPFASLLEVSNNPHICLGSWFICHICFPFPYVRNDLCFLASLLWDPLLNTECLLSSYPVSFHKYLLKTHWENRHEIYFCLLVSKTSFMVQFSIPMWIFPDNCNSVALIFLEANPAGFYNFITI